MTHDHLPRGLIAVIALISDDTLEAVTDRPTASRSCDRRSTRSRDEPSGIDARTMSNDAPVHIVPYDRDWPGSFEAERQLLTGAIGPWLVAGTIEHVGSTAIPGLDAKPVIDIMAGVESLDGSRAALAVLERHQYCYAPYRTEVMHWLCKPSPALRTHHLHLVPFGSPLWIEQLAFRDYLRTHRNVAVEYAALKRRLADAHRLDREAYTTAKAPFVQRVLGEALRLRQATPDCGGSSN